MSEPTEQDIKSLAVCLGDDERYHQVFDDLLEAKLYELDTNWMQAMARIYRQSGMKRWCA